MNHYEIVRTAAEQPFHTRVVASNGEEISRSSESYAGRLDAQRAIELEAEALGLIAERWVDGGLLVSHPNVGSWLVVVQIIDERTSRPS